MFVMCCVWLNFLILSANSDTLDVLRPKTVRVYKFSGTCSGHENTTIVFENVRLSVVKRLTIISLKVIVKNTIPGGLKLQLTLKRCRSREALDSCEKYQSVNIKHLCDLIKLKNTPWSPFVELAQPPLGGCPVRKGIHVVKRGTFDGSAFSHLPISGWYWIVMAKVYEEEMNQLVLCMTMEGQIAPI